MKGRFKMAETTAVEENSTGRSVSTYVVKGPKKTAYKPPRLGETVCFLHTRYPDEPMVAQVARVNPTEPTVILVVRNWHISRDEWLRSVPFSETPKRGAWSWPAAFNGWSLKPPEDGE